MTSFWESQRGSRAQGGVMAGLALALILILGVAVVGLSNPNLAGGPDSKNTQSNAQATAAGVEQSLESANAALLAESWSDDDLDLASPDEKAATKSIFGSGRWSSMDTNTREALSAQLGAFLLTSQASQTDKGDLSNIEPIKVNTTTRVDYYGWFRAQAEGPDDELILGEDIEYIHEGKIHIPPERVNQSRSFSLDIVVTHDDGQTYLEVWKNPVGEVRVLSDSGGDTGVSGDDVITIDLLEGTANGNSYGDGIDQNISNGEIKLKNIDDEWGHAELLFNGTSPIDHSNDDPSESTGAKARTLEIISSATLDIEYQTGDSTGTERVNYNFETDFDPSFSVSDPPKKSFFDVEIRWTEPTLENLSANDGDAVIAINVTNTGDLNDTQTIDLDGFNYGSTETSVDIEEREISLTGGESIGYTAEWEDVSDSLSCGTSFVCNLAFTNVTAASEDDSEEVRLFDGADENATVIDYPFSGNLRMSVASSMKPKEKYTISLYVVNKNSGDVYNNVDPGDHSIITSVPGAFFSPSIGKIKVSGDTPGGTGVICAILQSTEGEETLTEYPEGEQDKAPVANPGSITCQSITVEEGDNDGGDDPF